MWHHHLAPSLELVLQDTLNFRTYQELDRSKEIARMVRLLVERGGIEGEERKKREGRERQRKGEGGERGRARGRGMRREGWEEAKEGRVGRGG